MNLTPRCQRAVDNAKASLERFSHPCVSSAHLVLGIAKLENGVAANVLQNFRVTVEAIEDLLHTQNPSDTPYQEASLIGKSAHLSLQRAEVAASKFGHTYVGTEHLLLAIAVEENGPAASLFASLSAERKVIGREVFREIAPPELWNQSLDQ